ncbi:MAG: DUF4258 domain-containing protein [Planctomycetes bacterium]|nr:DUF4258 domain-containing protein [Planctomycetota bacterium]
MAKPIKYSAHALKRMLQRRIRQGQVEQVVSSPTQTSRAKRPGAKKLLKALSHARKLCVIVEDAGEFLFVITAYWK